MFEMIVTRFERSTLPLPVTGLTILMDNNPHIKFSTEAPIRISSFIIAKLVFDRFLGKLFELVEWKGSTFYQAPELLFKTQAVYLPILTLHITPKSNY